MTGNISSFYRPTPEDRQKQAEQKAMEDAQVWTLPGGGKQNVGDFRAMSPEDQWKNMGQTPPWMGGSYDLGYGTQAPPYRNPNIDKPLSPTDFNKAWGLPPIGAPTAPTGNTPAPTARPASPAPAPTPSPSPAAQPAGQGIPGYSKPQSFNVDQLMKFLTPQSPFQSYNFDDPFSDSSTGNNPF